MKNLKLISAFVAIFIYILFLFASLNKSVDLWEFNIDKTQNWDYSVSFDNDKINYLEYSDSEYKYNKITYFDDIYYSSDSKVKIDWNKINLNPWLYYISINELWKEYNISNDKFEVKNLTPWNLFIDVRDNKKYSIYSFDMIFEVSLKWDSENLSTAILYPHTIFRFDTRYNKFLAWADLYRLDTVNRITYINAPVISDDKKINSEFIKEVWYLSDEEWSNFWSKIIKFKDTKKYKEDYEALNKISIWNNLTTNLINKYFSIFYNKEKKEVYYKNLILSEIHSIFTFKWKNIDTKKTSEIKSEMQELKEISNDSYEEMNLIIKHYYKVLTMYNNIELLSTKETFWYLLSSLQNKKYNTDDVSTIINSAYNSFDSWNIDISWLYDSLNKYILNSYFDKNWKVLDNDKKYSDMVWISYTLSEIFKWKTSYINEKDEQLLKSNILLDDTNFSDIFTSYNKINNFLFWVFDSKFKETYTYIYNDLLKSLNPEFEKYYFEEELNSNWLYQVKKSYNKDVFYSLEKAINDNDWIIKFLKSNYFSYKWDLEELKKNISKTSNDFLAVSNYDEYEKENDKSLSEIFTAWVAVYEDEKIDNSISYNNFEKYISQFAWVDFFSHNLKIDKENQKYIVTDLKIFNKNFSFDLYPYDNYLMDNIYINSTKFDWIYYLLLTQKSWDTKSKDIFDQDEKWKYDFSKFFYNTFIKEKKIEETKIYTYEEPEIKFNPSEFKFVKDILLSTETWEFRRIKWNKIKLWLENIFLEKENEGYKIIIQDSEYNDTYDEQNIYKWKFSSNYKFSTNEHYFYDLSIKLNKIKANSEEEKMFLWFPIKVSWNVSIYDFEDTLDKLVNQIYYSDYIFDRVKSKIFDELEITYFNDWDYTSFKYYSTNSTNIEIKISKDWNVVSYKVDGVEKLEKIITYRQFKL